MLLWPHCWDAAGSDHHSTAALSHPPFPPHDNTYGYSLESEASPPTLASVPRHQQVDHKTTPNHKSGHKRTKQRKLVIGSDSQTSFPRQELGGLSVSQDPFLSAVKGCACFSRDDARAERPGCGRGKSPHAYCHERQGDEGDGCLRLCAATETAIAEDTGIVPNERTRWNVTTQQRPIAKKRAARTILVYRRLERQVTNWEMGANYDGGHDTNEPSMGGRSKEGTKRKSNINVKERIKAIEDKDTVLIKPGLPLRSTKSQHIVRQTDGPNPDEESTINNESGSGIRNGVPLVFPLHVRKFHRRRSNGSPLRPETPLYRSDPGQDTDIQSPLPQRTIPIVRAPSEASMPSSSVPPTSLTPSLSPMPAQSASGQTCSRVAATQGPANEGTAYRGDLLSPHPKHAKAGHHHPKTHVNPFSHFHGTRSACVRHGRKSGLGKQKPRRHNATKDMFERSRSGAYIPIGVNTLKQMEATSPWAFADSTTRCTELTCLTTEANKDDEDACPDCVAELGIKRREIEKAVSDWSNTAFPDPKGVAATPNPQLLAVPGEAFPAVPAALSVSDRAIRQESWKSTTVEPPDSESEVRSLTVSPASMHSARSAILDLDDPKRAVAPNPKRSRSVRFNSHSQKVEYDADPGLLIVSRDLGEELDAVILERGGTVEKVITNPRDRNRTPEIIAKIARELAQIASTLSSGNFGNRQSSDDDEPVGRTAVVDRNSDAGGGRSSRESSVPELLQLISEASNDLQPGLIRKPTWERVAGGHAWLDQTSANDFATEFQQSFTPFDSPKSIEEAQKMPLTSASARIVNRQTLDDDYRVLQDHALATTPHDHDLSFLRTHRRSLQSSTPLTTSTFYASRPSSSPTQNLGSPGIPITVSAGEPTLPSHVLRSRDLLDVSISRISPRPLGTPLLPKTSPCIFTASTAPSLTASAANSAQPSPREETQVAVRSPAEREGFWGSPSEVKANSQAIRHVMRMERMSAVQEAAALERLVRRRRMVEGEAKKALG
ncbi:hypothetical protein M409DRAFT_17344 [Zasmidium cellare ATCC 36951]|uniref:Uncharacterized protein n=1 Tax=Zasmidium cellare ATCC 36951 TaxID=1080233 RepID=A0A6A6D1Q6_ZASCE|nr:uncharacterized protein M409DRAFT_17344 [Zasmidium cellare ATCC 36951]KAF2172102.1 hypothetical protein M409DRAFT_17344 [Zasmidium cellare ATCC 36951]